MRTGQGEVITKKINKIAPELQTSDTITLPGRPITKKNHSRIYGKKLLPSKQFEAYQEMCLWTLMALRPRPHYEGRLLLTARYWMPDKRSEPDLINLLQATCDIMQAAKIVDNDKQFVRFDGSEVVGIDKTNPRAEILITELPDTIANI